MTSQDLAQKLAAHPRFEWRRGMHVLWPGTSRSGVVTHTGSLGWRIHYMTGGRSGAGWEKWPEGTTPDLADPATAGVLLEVLRQPPACVVVVVDDTTDATRVTVTAGWSPPVSAPTLGEACALALLELWGEP